MPQTPPHPQGGRRGVVSSSKSRWERHHPPTVRNIKSVEKPRPPQEASALMKEEERASRIHKGFLHRRDLRIWRGGPSSALGELRLSREAPPASRLAHSPFPPRMSNQGAPRSSPPWCILESGTSAGGHTVSRPWDFPLFFVSQPKPWASRGVRHAHPAHSRSLLGPSWKSQ